MTSSRLPWWLSQREASSWHQTPGFSLDGPCWPTYITSCSICGDASTEQRGCSFASVFLRLSAVDLHPRFQTWSLLPVSISGKAVHCSEEKAPPSLKLSPGNSLFTTLACDGGASWSIPKTDCHFDGDATRGESNSLSSSLWNAVYFLEGHKAPSEHRHAHTSMQVNTLVYKKNYICLL